LFKGRRHRGYISGKVLRGKGTPKAKKLIPSAPKMEQVRSTGEIQKQTDQNTVGKK